MNTAYNLKKYFACSALLLTFIATKAQQTTTYTQYINNITPINPVYSLFQQGGSINTTIRKQWIGVPGAPTSYLFNGSLPVESINASAGLIATNDDVAIEHLTEVNAFFAKGIRLDKKISLGVAINAGFRKYVADYSQINSADPVFSNDIHQSQPNIGFAVMLYSDQYYFGVSVPELSIFTLGNASVQNNVDFQTHYCFVAGATTTLSDDCQLKYSGLLSYVKGAPALGDVSALVYVRNTLGVGLNYKTNNEVAGMVSVNYDRFRIGYSYEFATNSNSIGSMVNSTNEISLGFRFGKGSQVK
jgi:type IX secretion system PorP/SprF family membrane protein